MTDDAYQRLLKALAAKHLSARSNRTDSHYLLHKQEEVLRDLKAVSALARLLKVVQDRPNDPEVEKILREELIKSSPIESCLHGNGLVIRIVC